MKYDVNYFLKKFEAIPCEQIIVGHFRGITGSCFLGHTMSDLAVSIAINGFNYNEKDGLPSFAPTSTQNHLYDECKALCLILDPKNARNGSILAININNGDDPRYQQPAPKQRILAALYDIKRIQEGENKIEESQPKVEYKLVYSDQKVKDLTKEELIMN